MVRNEVKRSNWLWEYFVRINCAQIFLFSNILFSDIETKNSNRNRTIIYIFITAAYLDITTLIYRFTCTIYDKNKFNNYKSSRCSF